MTTSIAAFVLGLCAWILATGLLSTVLKGMVPQDLRKSYLGLALLLLVAQCLSPHPGIFFILMLALVLRWNNGDYLIANSIFAIALIVPGKWAIPFPGINYLYNIGFAHFIALCVLLPAIFTNKRNNKKFYLLDVFVVIIFLAHLAGNINLPSFTSAARASVESFFTIVVSFFAASRLITSRKQVILFMEIVFVLAIIMTCYAIFASFLYWDFLRSVNYQLFGEINRVKSRGGLLRVGTSFSDAYINFGGFLSYCTLISSPLIAFAKSNLVKALASTLLLFGIFLATSRGAFVSLAFGLLVFGLTRRNAMRSIVYISVAGALAVGLVLVLPPLEGVREYLPFVGGEGGESYRMRLLKAGWELILRNPLFGDPFFMATPEMEALRQGEGIIDMVNLYLHMTLLFGIPVGIIYCLTFGIPVLSLVQRARQINHNDDGRWRLVVGAMAGGLASLFILYFSVSVRAQMEFLRWALLGVGVACVRVIDAEQTTRSGTVARTAHRQGGGVIA